MCNLIRNINKLAISGATSSLGVALIDECIKNKVSVLALVNPNSKNIARIPVHKSVKIEKCSLADISKFNVNDNKADAFIHLAWGNTHGNAERDMVSEHIENIKYSVDAVDLAERLGCKIFIGAGSQAEYGRTNEIITEMTECHPETPYGISKLCAGQMTRIACKSKGIEHIWTRILSSYGPKYIPDTVINYTIIELLKGRKPVLSAGEQIWDFIYSGDVANALFLLTKYGHDGEIYVIGSGHSEPLKNYLNIVRNIINPCLELGLGDRLYDDNAVMHLACDITKLKRDTGFEIKTSFKQGILKTIEWIKNNEI